MYVCPWEAAAECDFNENGFPAVLFFFEEEEEEPREPKTVLL